MTKTYSVKEVCEMLSISKVTLYRYIKQDKIKAVKFGKSWIITEKSLEEALHPTESK